jgi:hypothetical protein
MAADVDELGFEGSNGCDSVPKPISGKEVEAELEAAV